MAEQYKNPFDDAANQAVGALYKYYLTKPNPADIQAAQLKNELMGLQVEDARNQTAMFPLEMQKMKLGNSELQSALAKANLDLETARGERNAAQMFGDKFSSIPMTGQEKPLDAGQFGPNPAVTPTDRNSQIAGLFEQFAPKLNKDVIEASRDALGTAGALRFDNPVDRQLALDEKATTYGAFSEGVETDFQNRLKEPRVMTPGSVLIGPGPDYKQLASAPFKTGGGSYIKQPDGTIISIDGGGPTEMTTAVQTDLQTKDLAFDTYRTFTENYRNAVVNNPGGVGTRGNVARIADGLLGQVSSFAPGSEFETTLKNIVNTTAGQYTDPATGQVMNADLYDAATVASLLPFVAAEAIVGQGGRSLSNEDRELVRQAVGSPEQWMATPDKLTARMDQLDTIVENLRQKYQGRQLGQRPMTPAPGDDNLSMNKMVITPEAIDNMTEEELNAYLSGQ